MHINISVKSRCSFFFQIYFLKGKLLWIYGPRHLRLSGCLIAPLVAISVSDLPQELQQLPLNGVSAIFTGSRECTRVNPLLEIQHAGMAVGIAGSFTWECEASEAEPAAYQAFSDFHLRVLSDGLATLASEKEGAGCLKTSCQHLQCRFYMSTCPVHSSSPLCFTSKNVLGRNTNRKHFGAILWNPIVAIIRISAMHGNHSSQTKRSDKDGNFLTIKKSLFKRPYMGIQRFAIILNRRISPK